MLIQEDIQNFLDKTNYDLRISGNGRWIDQKCAADVVSVVADCILNYGLEHNDEFFTTPDIWHWEYTVENVEAIFRKPGVEHIEAKNEYDKFFQQPMEMLAYSGVLKKEKRGSRNYYAIANFEVLEYISLRERNALFFLKTYIEKVLRDSNIYYLFENFFQLQDKNSYVDMKQGYADFIIRYTKINGVVECNRIFIKVLNPLAYYNRTCGTERGKMSKQSITYDMLMYNRNNFRDIYSNKPKGTTRKEYAAEHPVEVNEAYYHYQSVKAKRFLRIFNNQTRGGKTEHLDGIHIYDKAVHMHHIFPEADYPEICFYLENLIALTPTQHLSYAHPNGRTTEIDNIYQHLLLLSKADRIKENLNSVTVEHIYEFSNFLHVLNVGFDDDDVLDIADMDFATVVNAINTHYAPVA
jgi:hypothetical protein